MLFPAGREICCRDLADVTLVNVRGAVMQQVLIDLCLEGVNVQLCLSFLPPRARLGPGQGDRHPCFLQEQR